MNFDVSQVPFSRFGSYLAFSIVPPSWGHKGLLLRTVRIAGGLRELFRLALLHGGREVPYTVTASPTLCRLECRHGFVELCFAETDLVRLRGRGVTLRFLSILDRGQYAFAIGPDRWQVNCAASSTQLLFIALRGALGMDAPHDVHTQDARRPSAPPDRPRVIADFIPDRAGRFDCAIHDFVTTPRRVDVSPSFDQSVRQVDAEWRRWLKTTPRVPARYAAAAELAMYVNWSATVAPAGLLRRPTMLMSKNWMTQCWSWDHCFNAIALSYRNPDLAWDQLMALFDPQDSSGVLPDSIHAGGASWNFCKPPIHGWALCKMLRNRRIRSPRRLKEIYPRLARWTNWWLRQRDNDRDGLPEYHHGNDSGWDNATVFDAGFPLAGPDLSAFLVTQMDALALLATRLARPREAQRWKARADTLLARLLKRLWNGSQFVSRKAFSGKVFPHGDCLLNFLPAVLGKRLPPAIRAALAAALQPGGRFLTAHGPATENPRSPLYVPDGYWRGPIWGPTTVIIADGLARAGFPGLAKEIARRYCDMCASTMAMAENYNALSGAPLRDKAYTWGSSSFLILAHELLA